MLDRRAFITGGAVALLLAACRNDDGPAPIVGRRAPDFTLPTLEGPQLTLSSLIGRPVVVNFFATWCVPCRQELPAFQTIATKYTERKLAFVLVDVQEDPDDVAVFLGDLRVDLPTTVDATGEVVKTYRVRGLPSTFFVDRDGVIRLAQLGALDQSILESGIAKIL